MTVTTERQIPWRATWSPLSKRITVGSVIQESIQSRERFLLDKRKNGSNIAALMQLQQEAPSGERGR